jgi:adenylate kinase
MIIAVSGTPGTGKTKLSKRLAKELKYKYLDVKKLIAEKKLSSGYDRKRKCQVVDTRKLNSALIKIIKENPNLVIDSHLSHYLPKDYVHRCIITTCGIEELKKRLEQRDYSDEKIGENLEAEIFETCLTEAEEAGHKVMAVDTTKNYNIESVIKVLGVKPR